MIPFPEYPRPLLERSSWLNLNGTWQYAFSGFGALPEKYAGDILVPYSPEAPKSGVGRQLKPGEYLHYRRTFTPPEGEGRVLLHFGAVDYLCYITVNDTLIGDHRGGYLPFTFDVTDALLPGENTLYVTVLDPSDTGHQARGMQKLSRGGMYYTAQSGIWQTVWMERVPAQHVTSLQTTPHIAEGSVTVTPRLSQDAPCPGAFITVRAGKATVAQATFDASQPVSLAIPNMRLWSPEDPFLYDFTLTLPSGDVVKSYFGMREFGTARDAKGILRFTLNGKPYFLNGLLDQGYWPEGLYTPPSEEAMVYDIQTMKDMGFNLLRKHIKIEPQRWYYHCDRLGMVVWQDMVNGGGVYKDWFVTTAINVVPWLLRRFPDTKPFYGMFARKNATERERYYEELEQMILLLESHPCIGCFVPFNEGWGQFDAPKATALIRSLDPQKRPVDETSGWFDQRGGDVDSIHNYFYPLHVRPSRKRVVALSEFGGVAWPCPGHITTEKAYGYGTAKTQEALAKRYDKLVRKSVLPQIRRGLSAIIYTQVSDVEDEINGILTYDREVVKLPKETALACAKALEDEFERRANA